MPTSGGTTPEKRFFTQDVVALSIATETAGGAFGTFNNVSNLVGVFTNAKISFDIETVTSNIPTDLFDIHIHGFEYHVFQGSQWNVDLSEVMEDTLDVDAFLYLALQNVPAAGAGGSTAHMAEIHRGLAFVNFQRPGSSGVFGAATIKNYQGLAWITRANIKASGATLISQSATLTGFGPLNVA